MHAMRVKNWHWQAAKGYVCCPGTTAAHAHDAQDRWSEYGHRQAAGTYVLLSQAVFIQRNLLAMFENSCCRDLIDRASVMTRS